MDRYSHIDTHAHVNINAFKDDWQEVIARAHEAGVALTNVGTQIDTSKRAVEIAEQYDDGVYAIIGLHPIHTSASYHDEQELGSESEGFTSRGEVFDVDAYRELAKSEKVIAIGETGLDYYRLSEGRGSVGAGGGEAHMTERRKEESSAYLRQSPELKEKQEAAFIEQIKLANELDLPLMIHTRDAAGNQESALAERSVYDDVYETLKEHARVPGNIHFYAGNWEQAKKFFDIGFSISFTGVITFAKDYEEIVRNAPIGMIHGETDCPYVAPKPYRGKRNEPSYVKEVYAAIAAIKGMDEEHLRAQLMENARRLYKIPL